MSTTDSLIRIGDQIINLHNVKTIRMEPGQVVFRFMDNKDLTISGEDRVAAVTAWLDKIQDISVPFQGGMRQLKGL